MSLISKKEVKHVAKLAELEFKDDELEKITTELDKILTHVARISQADTSEVKPTSHTLNMSNVFREDNIRESLSKEQALSNAPDTAGDGFKVPKID